jgi:hypothetical protein
VGIESVGRSKRHGVEQHLAFGGEPGQCLRVVGESTNGNSSLGRGEANRIAMRVQQQAGGVGGVEIMIQKPKDGRMLLVVGFVEASLFPGICAEQVVHAKPAGGVLSEQVGGGEFGEHRSRPPDGNTGQAGSGDGVNVRAGMQSE